MQNREQATVLRRPVRRPSRFRWKRWAAAALLAVAGLLGVAAGGAYYTARQSLPEISGALRLPGLSAPVSVYRDARGVPHIEAATRRDLYMAQGFVTAQDRLWQMDVSRRAAAGRLSEVFGGGRLEADKFLRSLMLRRSAEASLPIYSAETLEMLEAYSAGVNAFIEYATREGRLAPEFRLLGYKPEPWTPADSASIGKFMAYDLGGNYKNEVYYYLLRQTVGDELTREVLPVYPEDGPVIVRQGESETLAGHMAELPPDNSRIDLKGLVSLGMFPQEFLGSNNWVLSGAMTASGKPLLANDPHLGLGTPAIWYQTHLVLDHPREQLNVIGVTFPGAPGIVIGHNEKVAWGVTNTGPDVQDLYVERRNPQNPYQFEFMGKWENADVHKETIKVKGKPDVPFEVVVTRHGPIVSEVVGTKERRPGEALALKWAAHLPTNELEAVLEFNRAANWGEFREALRKFRVPTQNFVFAATDGTIAYRTGGLIPIRAKGDGIAPVPGWTGEYEWTDWIPFHLMPEVTNPAAGFIVTANHKVVGSSFPYLVATSWAPPYRALRITEMIQGKTGLTVDHMRGMQADHTNLQARTLLPHMLPSLKRSSFDRVGLDAISLLEAWDFVDAADRGAPLLYHVWRRHLTKQLYEPIMGKEVYGLMTDKDNVTDHMLRRAASGEESGWVKKAGGLDTLLAESFKNAVQEIRKQQGQDAMSWQWGKYHQIGPQHSVGSAVKPLGWFLNTKMYPVGGSGVTPSAMSFRGETGRVTNAAPWRQVVDLGNISDNSWDIVIPGQSGHFLSPWYQDQAPQHVKGLLQKQLFTPGSYGAASKLELQP